MPESTPGSEAVKEDPFANVAKPEPRAITLGATVNSEEEEAITRALASQDLPNKSAGMRRVLMAFAKDPATRRTAMSAIKRLDIE